jgi:heterodisulfide reductase subunit B
MACGKGEAMPTDATPSGGKQTDICYFPGCSLAASAKENNQSLINIFHRMGYNLVELPDWNCCGTSSAHSIHSDLAFDLASRNLSLVPPGKMLLAACPSCLLRLRHAQLHLKKSQSARKHYQDMWDRPFDPDLSITHFFEFLVSRDFKPYLNGRQKTLTGIRFAPYYGCMLNRPPDMRHEKNYHGLMEKTLAALGAEPLRWAFASQCCGTFLSAARPDVVTPIVNDIMRGAVDIGADCIVTACAMCHLNLELRCDRKNKIPTLHFSELLSLAMGEKNYCGWFARHLVDPLPMLKSKGLIE